eukprot:473564-Pyramimonas_sp.AAC.1
MNKNIRYAIASIVAFVCDRNADTGQDNDQYLGCVPSVLDAVWACKGTLLRWRGCPQQRHCEGSP